MKSSVRLLVSLLSVYRANLDRVVAKQVLKELEESGNNPVHPLLKPKPLTKNKKLPEYPSFPQAPYVPKYITTTGTATTTANPCQEIFLQDHTW